MPPKAFPKILVWTRFGPDFPSGSPAILAELLKHAPPDKIEVVCEYRPADERVRELSLPYAVRRYQGFRFLWPFARGFRARQWAMMLTFPWMLIYGLYRILRFRPQCIVTIYASAQWILSSYLLSRLTGLPLVFYVHDPFIERYAKANRLVRMFSHKLESSALRHATVVALYESLRDRYRGRYGIESAVVRHLSPQVSRSVTVDREPERNTRATIGFAGAIYENNREMMRDLVDVAGRSGNCRLRIWTNAGPDTQAYLGLPREYVSVEFESNYDRLLAKLRACDLLYLPLEFEGNPGLPRDCLDCVLPTKSVDYLVTRRPILVHCPADYETSRFFVDHRCGHVLNVGGADALGEWLGAWRGGAMTDVDPSDVESTLGEFDAEANSRRFFEIVEAAVAKDVDYSVVSQAVRNKDHVSAG
jgi:hypothetical protein